MDVRTKEAYAKLDMLSEEHGGFLCTSDAASQGISRPMLAKYVAEHGYERAARGIYMGPEAWPDDYYILQLRYPKLIFSHLSALLMHDMTDCLPGGAHVTMWTGYNPGRLSADCRKVYTVKRELHEMGLMTMNTVFGNPVRVYDRERTLCDIVRLHNRIDTQPFYDALKEYARDPNKNWVRLNAYADALKVRNIVDHYLEVLMA